MDRGVLRPARSAIVTLNKKDFADFAEHDGLVLLGENDTEAHDRR